MDIDNVFSFKISIDDAIEFTEGREASYAHPDDEIFVSEIGDCADTNSIGRRVLELALHVRRPSDTLLTKIDKSRSTTQHERIIECSVGDETARQ